MKRYYRLLLLVVCGLSLAPTASALTPQFILQWGSGGTGPGQFDEAYGCEIEHDGNVLILDRRGKRLQRFSPKGVYIDEFRDPSWSNPSELAINRSHMIYISNPGCSCVQSFSPDGGQISSIGMPGTGDGEFETPTGLAFDQKDNLFVGDLSGRVQVFGPTGTFAGAAGSKGSEPGQINGPIWIAFDKRNNVYISDRGNNRVQKFTTRGEFLGMWGSGGSGLGQFSYPGGIAVSPDGNVYVVDTGNARVQIFDSDGSFLGQFGSYGKKDGQFLSPIGIGIDAKGNIYVTDRIMNTVQKFSAVKRTTWAKLKALFR